MEIEWEKKKAATYQSIIEAKLRLEEEYEKLWSASGGFVESLENVCVPCLFYGKDRCWEGKEYFIDHFKLPRMLATLKLMKKHTQCFHKQRNDEGKF